MRRERGRGPPPWPGHWAGWRVSDVNTGHLPGSALIGWIIMSLRQLSYIKILFVHGLVGDFGCLELVLYGITELA